MHYCILVDNVADDSVNFFTRKYNFELKIEKLEKKVCTRRMLRLLKRDEPQKTKRKKIIEKIVSNDRVISVLAMH